MADLCWRVKLGEKEYDFNAHRDLTLSRMRKIKEWYGPELGRWANFILAISQGDPDAVACVLWIARNNAGEKNVPEPRLMTDLPIGTFMQEMETDETPDSEKEEGPTEDEPTQGSKKTSKS